MEKKKKGGMLAPKSGAPVGGGAMEKAGGKSKIWPDLEKEKKERPNKFQTGDQRGKKNQKGLFV